MSRHVEDEPCRMNPAATAAVSAARGMSVIASHRGSEAQPALSLSKGQSGVGRSAPMRHRTVRVSAAPSSQSPQTRIAGAALRSPSPKHALSSVEGSGTEMPGPAGRLTFGPGRGRGLPSERLTPLPHSLSPISERGKLSPSARITTRGRRVSLSSPPCGEEMAAASGGVAPALRVSKLQDSSCRAVLQILGKGERMSQRDDLVAAAVKDWTAKDRRAGELALQVSAPPAVLDSRFDSAAFLGALREERSAHQELRLLVRALYSSEPTHQ
jgi:hypothetical protein